MSKATAPTNHQYVCICEAGLQQCTHQYMLGLLRICWYITIIYDGKGERPWPLCSAPTVLHGTGRHLLDEGLGGSQDLHLHLHRSPTNTTTTVPAAQTIGHLIAVLLRPPQYRLEASTHPSDTPDIDDAVSSPTHRLYPCLPLTERRVSPALSSLAHPPRVRASAAI